MNLYYFFSKKLFYYKNRFLLLILFMALSAGNAFAQNQKISLSQNNITLQKAFESVERQAQISINYNKTKLNVNKRLTINVRDKNLSDVLDYLLVGTGFTYKIDSKYVIIVPVKEETQQQKTGRKSAVSGVVTDVNNEPIIGATIKLKDSNAGTITDLNGDFTLPLTGKSMIVISYVGYQSQDVRVSEGTSIRIILKEDAQTLNEVVVVGYGTQKKLNLTGAVSAVSGKEMIKRPVVNAATMLQGQIPGLRVVQNSGQPGSDNATFRVRGQGTYSGAGSDPLVLINGVPGSLTNLDPNIIESVSVLKDAASAAIYGSRAANGVVLVTTKKGSTSTTGSNFAAVYSGNFSVYSPTRMLNTVKNSAEYMTLFNQAKKNSGKSGLYDEKDIALYRDGGGSTEYPNFDWVDYMFNPTFVQSHNLSLSGNTDKTTYNVSINFNDQPGTMKGFKYKRYNFSVDLASNVTKWLKIGTYISASYGNRLQPRNGASDAFLCTLAQAPTAMPWLPDDGSGTTRYTFGAYPNIEQPNKNMLAMSAAGINTQNKTYDFNGQFYVELTPFKGFKWQTKIAGRYYDDKAKDWSGTKVPLYNYHTGEMVRNMDLGGGFIPGLTVTDNQTVYLNLYSFMEYKLPFANKDHNLTAMVGYNQEKNTSDYLWAKRINYQFNLPELDAGSQEKMENSGSKSEWAIMSYFFRANYDYKGKYLAEVNARYDGTSRIASQNRWGWFPSFSLGYRITEESFFKKLNQNWINNLKLRGSWGQLGNQNIGLYPYQAIVNMTDSYSFDNSSLTQGVAQTAYVNRDLKWETTTITDIGLDASVFNNRLSLVFDWYYKKTTDILRSAQVSDFIGLSAPTVNNGEMQNKGIEVAVNWNDFIKTGAMKGLQYNVGIYFDRSRNKLSKFGAEEKGGTTILREGIPYNSYYMLKSIGIFADDEEIKSSPKQFSDNTKPGDIKYFDANGDKKIDYEDRIVMDGQFPDFEYSFNAGASWKGFDFSVMFQGVAGIKSYVGAGAGVAPFAQGSIITKEYIKDMWTEENPYGAKNPRLYFADMGGGRNTRASSYYLRDASYLRMKNITFGYTFPSLWTRKAAIQKLRVFFSGDNLLTITDYEGLDPENGGNFLKYPQNKIFSFGLNVEF